MDLKQLQDYLDLLSKSLKDDETELLNMRIKSLTSFFPFNKYEYMLMYMLNKRVIKFEDYEKLRNDYISSNKYLDLYTFGPRKFGQTWAQVHIKDLDVRFKISDREIDPNYKGEYDLLFECSKVKHIKVEIKASRAVNKNNKGELSSKALSYKSKEPFWMNFQQIKLDISDLFIFLGVWTDEICYWIFSNDDIKSNKYLSHQHRSGLEYQIGITNNNLSDFEFYRVESFLISQNITERFCKI